MLILYVSDILYTSSWSSLALLLAVPPTNWCRTIRSCFWTSSRRWMVSLSAVCSDLLMRQSNYFPPLRCLLNDQYLYHLLLNSSLTVSCLLQHRYNYSYNLYWHNFLPCWPAAIKFNLSPSPTHILVLKHSTNFGLTCDSRMQSHVSIGKLYICLCPGDAIVLSC